MQKTFRNFGLLAVAGLVFVGCNPAPQNSNESISSPTSAVVTDSDMSSDEAMSDEMNEAKTIAEVAAEAGSFNTLLAAVEAAGLNSALTGSEPLTVFAPTDAAFEKLPQGTVEALLADTEKLTAILTYHIVPGEVLAKDVVALDSATTLEGSDVAITVSGSTVKINDATVTQADIMASNGVIHVIDTVLIPE